MTAPVSTSSSEKKWAFSAMKWTLACGALADLAQRLGLGVDGGGLVLAQPEADVGGDLGEQGFLVLEVPVEEALGHAGGLDDVLDAGLGEASLGEELGGAVDELLLALAPLRGQLAVGRRWALTVPGRAAGGDWGTPQSVPPA